MKSDKTYVLLYSILFALFLIGILYSYYHDNGFNVTQNTELQNEIGNATANGFNVDSTYFSSSSASDCTKELITACDNNAIGQFVCVNNEHASDFESQYKNIYSKPGVCAEYIIAGTISCAVQDNYCVAVDSN